MRLDTTHTEGTAAGASPPRSERGRLLLWMTMASVPVLIGAAWLLLDGAELGLRGPSAGLQQSLISAVGFFFLISLELAAVFIGVSVLLGVMQEYIPVNTLKRVIPDGVRGCIVAAGLGGLTPFCSCSTIPIMVGLLNAGVGFGPSTAFLIASPLVNPVVLSLFWLAFGWQVMMLYAAMTLTAAALFGLLWARLGLARQLRPVRIVGLPEGGSRRADLRGRLSASLTNAVGVFRAFLPYLLLGALIGSMIYGFVPADWVANVAGPDNPLSIPAAALIGIPLYIRADTMIPVGLALHEKGMGMGAIIALVVGGAGISLPEMILLAKVFKSRLLGTFIATVFIVAVAAGYVFNTVF